MSFTIYNKHVSEIDVDWIYRQSILSFIIIFEFCILSLLSVYSV
jgi:hypothetical protein